MPADTTTKGKFIVFEGVDGSGHSTQAHLLYGVLDEQRIPAVLTIEPTKESPVSEQIYDALFHKTTVEPKHLQELFVEDRKHHVENFVLPNLKKGITVIGDRYLFSTVAFGSLNADIDWLRAINKDFPLPDYTFIIDATPETCMERIGKRGTARDLFEKTEVLRKVRTAYQCMSEFYPNIHLVDGEQTIDAVHREILRLLRPS